MANFFVDKEAFYRDPIVVDGEEANHMIKVLRMKAGDCLTLFDGEGSCADGEIESIEGKSVLVKVIKRYASETEPKLKITLFQGIPKNPKMDMIIQKATELGVTRIVPVNTKRIVAKIDKEAKIERLQRIAFEAAKQCGRAYVPEVHSPVSFGKALEMMRELNCAIIPYECEKDGKLADCIPEGIETLGIIIGPEGGFEAAEVEKAEEAGVKRVTLGKRILRTETAGLIASALCLYIAGDMN
ncbi:MAG: 16S rRNA (uracil(1498)-N(3))-methyltransferase [Clostridia bacterium]|nr:16S rRNA (uracil(1498)-N(3))-methyltransferase [Clostridia bacterium]